MTDRANISLVEEFIGHDWSNYASYDSESRAHLLFQSHIDIRTFTKSSKEVWTTGTFGRISALQMFPGLQLPVTNKVVAESESSVPTKPLDLATGFLPSDLIVMALPSFPLASVNVSQSFIDITSNPQGDCSISAETGSVSLASSLVPLIEGNSQFQVTRSAFEKAGLNLEHITGVRFRIEGSGSGTVTLMGLRLVQAPSHENPGWVLSTVDFDNWNGRLVRPVPLNGNPEAGATYTQSTLWRSGDISGVDDPTPVDAEIGVVFNTGSRLNKNNVTLFFREQSKIFQSQLDLNGIPMAVFDGNAQPDVGNIQFNSRFVEEFDQQSMEDMDHLQSMESLERITTVNPLEQSWMYFQLAWGAGGSSLTIANSNAPGYSFSNAEILLESSTNYLMICSLVDTKARTRIYKLNSDFSVVQVPLFDSTLIDDDGVFKRRKGKIGWQASLGDPDAFIDSIRPRALNFAEYRSSPLRSETPVAGAQLFTNFTPSTQLWDGVLSPYPEGSEGVRVIKDKARAVTAESYKVNTLGTQGLQGLTTNLVEITDLSQLTIKFDLWFSGSARIDEKVAEPFSALYPGLGLFPSKTLFPKEGGVHNIIKHWPAIITRLISKEGTIIPLYTPEVEPNQWQTVTLTIPSDEVIQTGQYALEILQPSKLASTWWIDNVSISQRAMRWSARSVADDPWKGNYAPWTDFREVINTTTDGVILLPRGNELQLRAQALRQDATILQAPKIKPTYAQLGRLVWPEDALKGTTGPTATIPAPVIADRTFVFTSTSTPGTGAITSWEWTFGDGSRDVGETVTHTYATNGIYFVTLIVTDRNGNRAIATKEVAC